MEHSLVFFGGAVPGEPYNDVNVLNLATLEWKELSCTGVKPAARYEHVVTRVPGHQSIVVFGGAAENANFNDVHLLNTDTGVWSKPEIKGTAPSPRTLLCGADTVGSVLYVFGGGDQGQQPVADTQLHCLDLATWTWSQPATTGTGPTPRQGHTMCAVDDRLYMFGGMGGMSFYDDLFVLDTAAMAWSTPDVSGQPPTGRTAHGAAVIGRSMYVAGGLGLGPSPDPNMGPQPGPLDDLAVLDVDALKWTVPKLDSAPFNARLDFSMTAVKLYRADPADLADPAAVTSPMAAPLLPDAVTATGADTKPVGAPVIQDVTGQMVGNNPARPTLASLNTSSPYAAAATGATDALVVYGGMDVSGVFEDCMLMRPL